MKRRILAVLSLSLLLAGCGAPATEHRLAKVLEQIKAAVDKAAVDSKAHSDQIRAVIPLAEPLEGSLVFAAPYSISPKDRALRARFGQSACSEMAAFKGMGQRDHLFLIADGGVKAAISWNDGRFSFSGTILTESNHITSLCVDVDDGVLRAASVNCDVGETSIPVDGQDGRH